MFKDSYLLINKAFISGKEITFANITVEISVATVPGARISTNCTDFIEKGSKVELKSRIVSEEKLTECKNNYFREKYLEKENNYYGENISALKEIQEEFKKTENKKNEDSGLKTFYSGRVYAAGNVESENVSMRSIVAIGKAHHLKSIKVPIWTDLKDRKLKSMIKLSLKGWPVKLQSISTKLNSFSSILTGEDHGQGFADAIISELKALVNSNSKETGVDADIFKNIKEDLNFIINHIPFKGVNSGKSAFMNGKFRELLERIKDDSNPDFLSFWQVLLDIFDTEIIFLPFDVCGSSVLVKPRYDELAPSENYINVCHFKEVSNYNRFSNSFREATRVMLNVYTDVNMESYPILMNWCHVDYKKDYGGFLYKIKDYGTSTNTGTVGNVIEKTNKNNSRVEELNKIINGILNKHSKNALGMDILDQKGKEADIALVASDKSAYDSAKSELAKLEEENKKLKEDKEKSASKETSQNWGGFVNLSASGFNTVLSSLEKNKGVVDVTRDLNFFDVTKAANIATNTKENSTPIASSESVEKNISDLKVKIGVDNNSDKNKVTNSDFRPSVNRVLMQNTHDLIFGERNLSFNTVFTPTILPGLPVVMFENNNYDLCYSKVSSIVHNITPGSSSTDVSGTRTIDSEEGVSLSTYHTFYRSKKIDSDFINKYGIRMAKGKNGETLTVVDKTRTIEKGVTDAMPGGFSETMSESMKKSMINNPIEGFKRYPIDGDYIDAKYMRLKYVVKEDPFTKDSIFGIMMKRYSFMP